MPPQSWKSFGLACCLFCGLILHPAAVQPARAQSSEPKFEVAALRLGNSLDRTILNNQALLEKGQKPAPNGVTFSGSRVTVNGLVLKYIIATAYRTEMYRVTAPEWTGQASVVIQALMPEGTNKDQLPEMLRALLAERFHLLAHIATSDEPAYALVKAKNGPKLNPPRDMDVSSCADWESDRSFNDGRGCNNARQVNGQVARTLMGVGGSYGPMRADFSGDATREEYFGITMPQLALRLSTPCNRGCTGLPVVDRTGITGAWDIVLDRLCSQEACDSYASALEKIGLKLEKTTAPIEHLVVDQIDKVPADN